MRGSGGSRHVVWGARGAEGAEVERRRREDRGAEGAEGGGAYFFNLLLKMACFGRF